MKRCGVDDVKWDVGVVFDEGLLQYGCAAFLKDWPLSRCFACAARAVMLRIETKFYILFKMLSVSDGTIRANDNIFTSAFSIK